MTACRFTLIAGSALLFTGSLAFSGLAYYYYAGSPACGLNIFFITWTIIAGLLCAGLSVPPPPFPSVVACFPAIADTFKCLPHSCAINCSTSTGDLLAWSMKLQSGGGQPPPPLPLPLPAASPPKQYHHSLACMPEMQHHISPHVCLPAISQGFVLYMALHFSMTCVCSAGVPHT